ncbi:MAG: hypothetical protein LDLANPLL_01714 [Turneriella sp.]|nr:hypothetical protein [Turneriella sp.]
MMYPRTYNLLFVAFAFLLPFCASAEWREGFHGANRLQLVGESKVSESEPQIRAIQMAKEAAVMDALSHWIKFCSALTSSEGIAAFRVENQKERRVQCSDTQCRARVIIEKQDLKQRCSAK